MTYYHGTPVSKQLEFADEVLDLCLTRDVFAALSYGEFVHVFNVRCKNIADLSDLIELFPEIEGTEMPFSVLDRASARQALVDAGFDGAEFDDFHECGQMKTLRVLAVSALSFVRVATFDWDSAELEAA